MEPARFDDFVRSFASAGSRRSFMAEARGGASAAPTDSPATRQSTPASAPAAAKPMPGAPPSICANPDRTGLQDRAPGDLVAFEEISEPSDPNFPKAARAWRVLYVSTRRDNTERTLVCGVVVAPADRAWIATADVDGRPTGRVVAWAHGTLGLVHRCQPSVQPALEIWGEPPYGINAVAWGAAASGDRHTGTPEHGILAGMIDAGWIVAATDYYADLWGDGSLQPFIIGKIEAANVVDCVRAAHHLLCRLDDGYALNAYDVVTWGHSQGGHSALWAGQLLASYTAATAAGDGPALALSGVALEAPGNTLVVQPDEQPDTAPGYGLLDWIANARLKLTGVPEPIPVGPFFLSYLFGAWAQHAGRGPADATAMPAYPDVGALDLSAMVTPAGLDTLGQMTQICWADGAPVAELAAPFANQAFLTPALGEGPTIDGAQHGNFDATCAGDPSPAIARWCDWFRYNLPGPLGKHPLDKIPRRAGALVPVMIAAGGNDGVVHCVTQPEGADAVPSARDCPAVSLYDALRAEYCPAGGARGYLAFDVWTPKAGITEADHSDITGLVAAASVEKPAFAGSPLQRFMQAAFDGTLEPGCVAAVVETPERA
jgi:hypothetical protein